MDRRTRELHSIKRLAEWTVTDPNECEWFSRSSGTQYGRGPVLELEVGYRAATHVLHFQHIEDQTWRNEF